MLKQSNAHFKELFQQGVPAYELVPARAQFMDEVLQRVWRRFFEADTPDLTLAAVGGYGRGELHPSSDVDLMILLTIRRWILVALESRTFNFPVGYRTGGRS